MVRLILNIKIRQTQPSAQVSIRVGQASLSRDRLCTICLSQEECEFGVRDYTDSHPSEEGKVRRREEGFPVTSESQWERLRESLFGAEIIMSLFRDFRFMTQCIFMCYVLESLLSSRLSLLLSSRLLQKAVVYLLFGLWQRIRTYSI